MKVIGGVDNNIPNSKATTVKVMTDAGYKWDEEKQYWVRGE